ncbi:MAG: hypothetical protein AAGA91_01130 [Pseudomonadota bacterium]
MRLIGMILALGVVFWALYQFAGGGEAETAIPEPYQKSLEKAENLELEVQNAVENKLDELDN